MQCLVGDTEDLIGTHVGQLDRIKVWGKYRCPLLGIVEGQNITNLIGNQHDLGHVTGEPVVRCVEDVLVRFSRCSVHRCELWTQEVQRLPVQRLDQQFPG
ncbi:hypothetical protein D3C85_1372650 [compost metagenome]